MAIRSSLNDLAQVADICGFQPQVQPGDVFWVPNRVLKRYTLSFQSMPDDNFHAVIVISVGSRWANARVMTSKVHRYWRHGLPYIPMPEVGLRRPGIILTKRCLRRRVPLTSLEQSKYLGNVGPEVLQRIRHHEHRLELSNPSADHSPIVQGEPELPYRRSRGREAALVDQLLNSLQFKAAQFLGARS